MTTLVLVTGTGRSGTSTMAGTLHHLGLSVPGPYLGSNDSNPQGFYESRWSVRFHRRITTAAGINDVDARPEALAMARAVVDDRLTDRLRAFLAQQTAAHEQVVVKDPRSVWAHEVWRTVAAELGLALRYVSMLRHPAEVVGSRTTYYSATDDERERRSYQTCQLARWINNSLVNEQQTRGHPRAFVPYSALLEDWRPVMASLADDLQLTYDVDVAGGEPSPVDTFIDPALRRHRITWDDLDLPERLTGIGQGVWEDLLALATAHGADTRASADLDRLAERYGALFQESADIAQDAIATERTDVGRRAQRERARNSAGARPSASGWSTDEGPGDPEARPGGVLRSVAHRLRRFGR